MSRGTWYGSPPITFFPRWERCPPSAPPGWFCPTVGPVADRVDVVSRTCEVVRRR